MVTIFLISGPAFGATKSSDIVNVLYWRFDAKDPAIQTEEKIYSKPYGQLKLDNKTKAQITAFNNELDRSSGGIEKFRLVWIRIVDDNVQGYMFQGSRSSTWLIEPADQYNGGKHRYMHISLDGNGGFACREGSPYQDN